MAKMNVIFLKRMGAERYEVDRENFVKVGEGDGVWEKLRDGQVSVVVADSLCYLYQTEVEGEINRANVWEKIKTDIPENLGENDWDFQKIDNSNKVLVFAVVDEYKNTLDDLAQKFNFKVIAMEPETISAERNPNPILGIVAKTDLNKKDEESLNLKIDNQFKKKNKGGIIFLGVIVVVIINLFLYKSFFTPKEEKSVVLPTPTAIPSIVKIDEIKFEDLKIRVLNGSGVTGAAGKVAAKLKEAGVVTVETGNADSDSYEKNIISFKNDELKTMFLEKMGEVVGEGEIKVDSEIVDDVIVILGKN